MSYDNNSKVNNRRNGFNNDSNKDYQRQSEIPQAVIIDGFYEADGETIKSDLFDSKALEIANSFVEKKENNKDNIGVTTTQLRRIFDEVKRFEQILSIRDKQDCQWEKQLPYIKMIKSKVAYAVARTIKTSGNKKNVCNNMKQFLDSCIDLVKTERDYHIFVSLFEAVYGYYYELSPKNCK